jgi:Concanavalin A-like lectin/glucanases superfamily
VNLRAAVSAAVLMLPIMSCSEAPLDAVGLPPRVLTDGLVAHWPFDEAGGTVARDGSGNGHDGQLNGGAWIADGRFAGGLRLAAGDVLSVADFPAATPSWSVSLWIRLSNEQLAADSDTFTEILSTENIGSAGWQINIDKRLAQPRFVFSYWAPPLMGYVGTECSCVETGAWIHLAAVVDVDANRLTLYVDGTVADQATRPSDILHGDSTLYFGRWNMGDRLFDGDLDDVAIWARALTPEEITALTRQSPVR